MYPFIAAVSLAAAILLISYTTQITEQLTKSCRINRLTRQPPLRI